MLTGEAEGDSEWRLYGRRSEAEGIRNPRLEGATYKTKSGPHDGSKTQGKKCELEPSLCYGGKWVDL